MGSDETIDWPGKWEEAIPAVRRVVVSVCRHLGLSPDDTDDMLQISLLRLMIEASAGKRDFSSIPATCAWFSRFVRSQVRRQRFARSREGQTSADAMTAVPAAGDGTGDADDIMNYLSLLDVRREREVMSLRYVEGLGFKAIAKQLGVSTTLAHNIHRAALAKLRKRLSK